MALELPTLDLSNYVEVKMSKAVTLPPTQQVGALHELVERIDMLEYFTARYSGTFEQVERHCHRMAAFQKHCILFDFDVVRTFMYTPIMAQADVLAIDYFLEKGNVTFAFPAGCLLELIENLTGARNLANRLLTLIKRDEKINSFGTRELYLLLSDAMKINRARFQTMEELEERICKKLGQRTEQLSRLLLLLEHPKFRGVRVDYSQAAFSSWLSILKIRPREHRKQSLAPYLDRDAMNLSITAWDLDQSQQRKTHVAHGEGYILVTQTQQLLSLIDRASDEQRLRQSLFQHFSINLLDAKANYPVMQPSDLVTLTITGGGDTAWSFKQAAARCGHCLNVYQKIRSEASSIIKQNIEGRAQEDLISRWRQQELRKALQDIHVELNERSIATELLGVTRFQTGIDTASVQIAKIAESNNESETEMQSKAWLFTKKFAAVLQNLGGTGAPTYTEKISKKLGEPFTRFSIVEMPGESVNLIEGEIYDGESDTAYFAARWPCSCTDADFVTALEEVWNDPKEFFEKSKPFLGIRKLENESDPAGRHCIIIETNIGIFAISPMTKGFSWNSLRLDSILPLLRNFGPIGRNTASEYSMPLSVDRVRLCGSQLELTYDVIPDMSKMRRSLSVISSRSLHSDLAKLYTHTSTRFVIEQKLSKSVSKVLIQFPKS